MTKLHRVLTEDETDVVALGESGLPFARRVSTVTRSLSSASLILFDSFTTEIDSSKFDVVIPYGAALSDWLVRISKAIEASRALRAEAKTIRQQAKILRRASMLENRRARRELSRANIERSNFDRQQLFNDNGPALVTPELVTLQSRIFNLQYLLLQPNLSEAQKERLQHALLEVEVRIREIFPLY